MSEWREVSVSESGGICVCQSEGDVSVSELGGNITLAELSFLSWFLKGSNKELGFGLVARIFSAGDAIVI